MEMYLAEVSVRRVEDITEALWGMRVNAGTVSELNQKLYERIETWRNQPIQGEHPYVYLDGIWLKRTWAGEVSVGPGGSWGGSEGLPGYPGGDGRPQGGPGELAGLPVTPEGTGAQGYTTDRLGQVHGLGGGGGGVLSPGPTAAMCGPLVSEPLQ